MKLKKLWLVALAAISLVGCTKIVEKEIEVPVEQEESGTAHLRIALDPGVLKSKAISDNHMDEKPTEDELYIYNYAVFIFKSSGMLEASLIRTIATQQNGLAPLNYYDQPEELRFYSDENPNVDANGVLTVSAGAKSFFAILNAPADLLVRQNEFLENNGLTRQTALEQQLSFDDLAKIVGSYGSETDGDLIYFENENANNRGFMMTTYESSFQTQTLEETDEGQAEDVELKVGRAMAKVSLASMLEPAPAGLAQQDEDGNPAQPNGTLEVYEYKIINNPKAMYVVPNITAGILTTPYYYNDLTTDGSYFESHNTSHADSDPDVDGYLPPSTQGNVTFTYAIENANLTPKHGNATIALVKGQFVPAGQAQIYDKPSTMNGTTMADADNNTFYRIFIKSYTNQNSNVLAGNKYAEYYFTAPLDDDELLAYYTKEKAEEGFPDNIDLTNIGDLLEVVEYTNGICYYRLPLYNSANTMSPYTVKRNSYYRIDIVSVSEPGYPDPDGPGPEVPLEPQSDIKVVITVEDWDLVDQPGKL